MFAHTLSVLVLVFVLVVATRLQKLCYADYNKRDRKLTVTKVVFFFFYQIFFLLLMNKLVHRAADVPPCINRIISW
jgi:hypothetical protein